MNVAGWRVNAILVVLLAAFVLVMAAIVVGAFNRPNPPAFEISPLRLVPVGDTLVGPIQVTLDATSDRDWTFLDFSRGGVVQAPGPLDWDLAVRRFHLIANGGPGYPGGGGIRDLGAVPFDSVGEVPDTGYLGNASDSTNPGVGKWYTYSWMSHLLTPKGHTYALRTADGRYGKAEIVSYYCPGARPGCFTIRYSYQGNGSRTFR